MKLIKKVLSSLCALSLAMTTMASFAVNADETKPTLVPEITVNETNGTATIVFTAKNVPTTVTGGGYTDPAYVYSFGCQMDLSFAAKDVTSLGRDYNKWVSDHFVAGYLGKAPVASEKAYNLSYGGTFDNAPDATAKGQVASEFVLCTIKDVPLSETSLKEGFTVTVPKFQLVLNNEYFGQPDYDCEVGFDLALGTAAVETGSWEPAGGDDTPTITQGVVETEDANDEAVWAWTTAAATGKFLKVYADVTKVGETEATAVNNIFEIPANVEATNVKVGIVVQYNPTNIAEFVVTGMEIVSSAN